MTHFAQYLLLYSLLYPLYFLMLFTSFNKVIKTVPLIVHFHNIYIITLCGHKQFYFVKTKSQTITADVVIKQQQTSALITLLCSLS